MVQGFRGQARIAQKAALTMGSQGIGTMLGFVALLAIGRYYAPGSYGAYVFAVSFIGLFSTLFQFGFRQAHQREVAQGLATDRALGVYVRIRGALLAAMALLLTGGLLIWTRYFGGGFTDATSMRVVIIILLAALLGSAQRVLADTWLGQGRVHRVEWCNTIDSTVYAATVALVGLGLGHARGRWIPFEPLGAAVDNLLGLPSAAAPIELATYIAVGHFIGKVAGLSLALGWFAADGDRLGPWDSDLARAYRTFALPLAVSGTIAILLQHMDVLMLGFFWSVREVGWYGAAQRIANVAVIASISLRGVLMPYLSSLLKADAERAMHAFRRAERYLLVAVVPLVLSMIIWPREGLHIFVGDGFLGAAPALQWLALWALVNAMNMPVRAKQMAAGHTQIIMRVVLINVTVNAVLNVILIPRSLLGVPLAGMGHTGAALATFLSTLAAYAYNRYAARRLFAVPLFDRAQARVFLAGLAPAGLWLWMGATLPPSAFDRFWELAGVGILGGLAYAVALVVTRSVRRGDVAFFRRGVSPRELAKEARGRG